ncbi:Epidermis-specific secreted glycoprotein EP1 precursor, putative [Ricinus communis]|uniref:Epidermis-specific secreted glycoprotein EP1, putative n=1 Tax=Ricinus communis TaxID=3988 RepID=B9T1A4_RICCO|nr:Epidermis-specific secreted glycoprotein EP1 precursor, putative [Ricinus communis]
MSSRFHLLFLFTVIVFQAQALVPKDKTFEYVNNDVFGHYPQEYDASYRFTGLLNRPFKLCFYNTTSNAFTLALGLGTQKEATPMNWVWEANRGNPVGENAKLTFETDGNLVLTHSDGRIAWQTNTVNRGVVGLEILPNGNMVLYDKKGKFIWQSFDYPTDTLLVGQSLRLGATTKLVSRASQKENVNGPYSLVMDAKTLALYYKSPNSPIPFQYFSFSFWATVMEVDGPLQSVTLESNLTLSFQGAHSSSRESAILE